MAQFLEKATSALSEAKESVTSTAESVTASLTDAEKTVNQTARSTLTDAETTVAASVETVKTEAAAAPDKASGVSTQVGVGHKLLHVFYRPSKTNKTRF